MSCMTSSLVTCRGLARNSRGPSVSGLFVYLSPWSTLSTLSPYPFVLTFGVVGVGDLTPPLLLGTTEW